MMKLCDFALKQKKMFLKNLKLTSYNPYDNVEHEQQIEQNNTTTTTTSTTTTYDDDGDGFLLIKTKSHAYAAQTVSFSSWNWTEATRYGAIFNSVLLAIAIIELSWEWIETELRMNIVAERFCLRAWMVMWTYLYGA